MRLPLVALVAAAFCVACWSEPRAPRPGSAVPGTIWLTPAQAWRTPRAPAIVAIDGDHLMLGGADGWIAKLDLATGLVVRERRGGELFVTGLVELRDGRWLAVGRIGSRPSGIVLDPVTFAVSEPLVLGAVAGDHATTGAAVLPDGGVVIAGQGLPLAVYDPSTWKIRRVIDPSLGWSAPSLDGDRLVAVQKARVQHFTLSTGDKVELGITSIPSVAGGVTVIRGYASGDWYPEIYDGTKKLSRLPDAIDELALDPAGQRLVTLRRGIVRVHAMPGGAELARFDLGPSQRRVRGTVRFAGERIVVVLGSVVRVIDLASSAITPEGAAPVGGAEQIMVGNDGAVLVLGAQAWRVVDGKPSAPGTIELDELAMNPPGELRRYATIEGKHGGAIVRIRALEDDERSRWQTDQTVLKGWLAPNGEVALEVMMGSTAPSRLMRSVDDALVEAVRFNSDANVADVDLAGGIALVEWKGTLHPVATKDGARGPHALRAPNCAAFATATIERGGDRVAAYDEKDVIVWERATGKARATLAAGHWVAQVSFVPGRDELLVALPEQLLLWSFGTGQLRSLDVRDWEAVAVSPDGRRLALGFGDGRIALVDLEVLRREMRVGAAAPAKVPAACPAGDPFVVPADELPEDTRGFDESDDDGYDDGSYDVDDDANDPDVDDADEASGD